jgi:hypothetical protein
MGAGIDSEMPEEVMEESESIDTPIEEESGNDSVENPDISQPNA